MRKHRGLSAIVGSVFLVAVVIGSLSYVTYSMNVLGNFSESLIVEEKRQRDKQGEDFEISSIKITPKSKLNGVVTNTGQVPLEIKSIWIEKIGTSNSIKKFDIGKTIAPGDQFDLINNVNFTMDPTKGYAMKIISGRGVMQTFYVNSLANESVYMKLTATPTIIPSTFKSTLLFTVANNMSNGNYLYNLTPVMNSTRQILSDTSEGLDYSIDGPVPSTYDSLGPGEVAVFTYEVTLTGKTDNDTHIFNVTLANANPGNEALARVSVKAVPLATDAGSALTSFGVTEAAGQLTDVLYFHNDQFGTPVNSYQMDGSSPNTNGLTLSPNGKKLEFISSPVTAITTVSAGKFDAILTYYSSIVPLGFPKPDFAFMMDCRDCGDDNEIGSSVNDWDLDQGLTEWNSPEFSADGGSETPKGGPDGDEYYHFDDADDEELYTNFDTSLAAYLNDLHVGHYPDADAFWVRIDSTADTNVPIIVASEDWDIADAAHNDFYGFWLIDAGDIRYGWETAHTHHGTYPDTRNCDSPAGDGIIYDDGAWHHIVGIRDGAYSCKLYIDGKLMASASTGSGDNEVDVTGWSIGYDMYNDGDFSGDVASWIHWNGVDNDLSSIPTTQQQVQDLYFTNYGKNATRLNMKLEVVDSNGATVSVIKEELKKQLPFKDVVLGNTLTQAGDWINLATANTTDAKYYGDANGDTAVKFKANLTSTTTSVTTLQTGERLKLSLEWPGNQQNLPINIMFDDGSGWVYPDGPSYLETPDPNPRWPTYLTFDSRESIKYTAYNEGPEGIWFIYPGTRLVLTSADGLNSYAATPQYVNKTTAPSVVEAEINPTRDSMYIPDDFVAEIEFWPIQAPPDDNSNISGCAPECEVPNGSYDAALYLQGYDEAGETFKKTIKLGLVRIIGNP